jgi:hypothetical protein
MGSIFGKIEVEKDIWAEVPLPHRILPADKYRGKRLNPPPSITAPSGPDHLHLLVPTRLSLGAMLGNRTS